MNTMQEFINLHKEFLVKKERTFPEVEKLILTELFSQATSLQSFSTSYHWMTKQGGMRSPLLQLSRINQVVVDVKPKPICFLNVPIATDNHKSWLLEANINESDLYLLVSVLKELESILHAKTYVREDFIKENS